MATASGYCARCGNALSDESDQYCRRCGAEVRSSGSPPPSSVPSAPPSSQPPTVIMVGDTRRSQSLAWAWFVGVVGLVVVGRMALAIDVRATLIGMAVALGGLLLESGFAAGSVSVLVTKIALSGAALAAVWAMSLVGHLDLPIPGVGPIDLVPACSRAGEPCDWPPDVCTAKVGAGASDTIIIRNIPVSTTVRAEVVVAFDGIVLPGLRPDIHISVKGPDGRTIFAEMAKASGDSINFSATAPGSYEVIVDNSDSRIYAKKVDLKFLPPSGGKYIPDPSQYTRRIGAGASVSIPLKVPPDRVLEAYTKVTFDTPVQPPGMTPDISVRVDGPVGRVKVDGPVGPVKDETQILNGASIGFTATAEGTYTIVLSNQQWFGKVVELEFR